MTYREREELKSTGRQKLADATKPLAERKDGLLDIIWAHYERSLGFGAGLRVQNRPTSEYQSGNRFGFISLFFLEGPL